MIARRLTQLIEEHSEDLARGLLRKIQNSEEMPDFKKVPAFELQERTFEIYRNLSDWLVNKTEKDIERTYTEIAMRRMAQGVAFSQFFCALVSTKEQLWEFLQDERLEEKFVNIYGELQLIRQVDRFFDRALYYASRAYEQREAERRALTHCGAR